MLIFFLLMLFIFGTMFGSFASVIIYRLKSGEKGIVNGRSHCKTCERNLTPLELIPIFSWLFQGGKCKGCKKGISYIYPLLELTMGVLFVSTGYFMIDYASLLMGSSFEIVKLFFYLSIIFFTVIYVFYDILYLEIPESILLISNIGVLTALIIEMFFAQYLDARFPLFPWMEYMNGGNMLWLQIFIAIITLGGLYIIMLKGMKEIYDVGILIGLWALILGSNYFIFSESMTLGFESPLMSALLGAMSLFTFFFAQILVSGGSWMGGGDLRIAILSGFIAGIYFILPAGFITYISGSIIGILIILIAKSKNGKESTFQHQIPFGPFIAMGYLGVMFFSPMIANIIALYF